MNPPNLSRREFLKLAALGMFTWAAPFPIQKLRSPALCPLPPASGSVLTPEQLQRLAAAARTFIAPDFDGARQVALDIDFIEGRNEDASTMCGPLAIAILQTAGLLGPWASRHDFWLVDPHANPRPFQDTFPESLYDWFEFEESTSQFDPNAFPLVAGDLIYLQSAAGDTYEHVILVNRVDEAGRAYTICNLFIGDGTIIDERMLYDPSLPGNGQLYDWTNRSLRKEMGNTGSGGYHVWRVKDGRSLEFPTDTNSVQLRESLDQLLLAAAGTWYGRIQEIGGPLLHQFNPYASFHPASTIKVPVALAFYHWLEGQGLTDWHTYLSEHGVGGRTYAQLLEAMIIESEEEATEVLVGFLGKAWLDEIWLSWGLTRTHADPRRSSATNISMAFESLYTRNWISPASKAHLLALMETYTANDDARLGLLRPRLPEDTVIYNKRGSLVDWPRVVGDSGVLQLPGAGAPAFLFTLHGIGKDAAGYEELEATLNQAIAVFGDFLTAQAT
ncbi:MAG: serine hydrolase [Anaerolineales bacterium]